MVHGESNKLIRPGIAKNDKNNGTITTTDKPTKPHPNSQRTTLQTCIRAPNIRRNTHTSQHSTLTVWRCGVGGRRCGGLRDSEGDMLGAGRPHPTHPAAPGTPARPPQQHRLPLRGGDCNDKAAAVFHGEALEARRAQAQGTRSCLGCGLNTLCLMQVFPLCRCTNPHSHGTSKMKVCCLPG